MPKATWLEMEETGFELLTLKLLFNSFSVEWIHSVIYNLLYAKHAASYYRGGDLCAYSNTRDQNWEQI